MPGLIRKYIFSTDHKVIGLQYGFTSMFFLLVGFFLVMLIRWQQAFPAQPIPLVGGWLGEANAPGGVLLPEFYNQLGAMHGTIMVFLGVVPLAFGAFGNYIVPLQIGAPDMAFPRLNMASFWLAMPAGLMMLASFAVVGGAANAGWTAYAPLSVMPEYSGVHLGQQLWELSLVILGFSMVLKAIAQKGQYGGIPARTAREWRREIAGVHRLGQLQERVRELERRAGITHTDTGDDGGEENA